MGGKSRASQQEDSARLSFFQRLLSLFLGGDDKDREKRKLLKQIAADLSRRKSKYYKPRSGEALGGLSKFFFEIYRIIGPAHTLLHGSENSKAFRTILIEGHHSEQQKADRERFSEEAIREAAKSMLPDEIVAQVKTAMGSYVSGFDPATVKRINHTYNLIQQLVAFVRFDYFVILRKFDSSIQEGSYTNAPRSDSINAEYISDDIKDFLEVLLSLELDADWDMAIDAIEHYRGTEVVSRESWKKLMSNLSSVVRSEVLVQIVRLTDEDPWYTPLIQPEQFRIVESHLTGLKSEVESFLQQLMRGLRGQKVQDMAAAVFGSGTVQRTQHYTEAAKASFTKHSVSGFAHTEAFNYLSAFLLDYFSVDVRMIVSELFIVRAKWTDNSVSSQLSEAFYATLNSAEQVDQFDRSIAEDGEQGALMRKASGPLKDSDPKSSRILRQVLRDIDEQALSLIRESATNLIIIARIMKTLIGDHERESAEIITNWKELEAQSAEPLKRQMTSVYKKIYHFIQLMQMFVKK